MDCGPGFLLKEDKNQPERSFYNLESQTLFLLITFNWSKHYLLTLKKVISYNVNIMYKEFFIRKWYHIFLFTVLHNRTMSTKHYIFIYSGLKYAFPVSIQDVCCLSAVWIAVALWPPPVGSFGVLVLVAIVTEQLTWLSSHCRRRNGSNVHSEVLSRFTALLQYGSLWVFLTKHWKASWSFQLGNPTCPKTQDNHFIHNFFSLDGLTLTV